MTKIWFAVSCPVCGFRHPLRKFTASLTPIAYPIQVVTGGGRAKGFKVARRIGWASLPSLDPSSDLMQAVNCEYSRLAEAYDNFHFYLGYLSPAMKALTDSLREEIFRLRARIEMLANRTDRLQLMSTIERSDEVGGIEEIIQRVQEREEQEADGRRELLRGLHRQARNCSDQRSVR